MGFGDTVPAYAGDLPGIAATGIDVCDLDDLFSAVKDRLLSSVSAGTVDASNATVCQIRNTVRECVEALEQLHSSLASALTSSERLRVETFDAQYSLAQLRYALVGTREAERKARHLAEHDALTLLPVRGLLVERLAHEMTKPDPARRQFAVMLLDLDAFKAVNDEHGYVIGDQLLRIVAARLRRAVRAHDLVCRVSGDRFACLIAGLSDQAQLAQLAGKLADAVSAPCILGALRLAVHASIGIAISPTDGSSADALLNNADLAMVAAKRHRIGYAFVSRDDADNPAARQSPQSQCQLLQ